MLPAECKLFKGKGYTLHALYQLQYFLHGTGSKIWTRWKAKEKKAWEANAKHNKFNFYFIVWLFFGLP